MTDDMAPSDDMTDNAMTSPAVAGDCPMAGPPILLANWSSRSSRIPAEAIAYFLCI